MQYSHSPERLQPGLFDAVLMASPGRTLLDTAPVDTTETFSELALRGSHQHCRYLLGSIFRELSLAADARWLTLIAPPALISPAWLRDAQLNRERIMLLQPRGEQSALNLACEALRLGRSHTVISWLRPLAPSACRLLASAAHQGGAQSLNIRLD